MANEPNITDTLKTALADIQQPALPDEFYLAPGWLLLVLPILVAIAWLGRKWYRTYRRDSARRLALQALSQIQLEQPEAANAILQLLKQYLQTKRPGHPALAEKSTGFVAFLQRSGKLSEQQPDLDQLLYSRTSDPSQLKAWHQFAWLWLEQHREQGLDV